MFLSSIFTFASIVTASVIYGTHDERLRIENFVNTGPSLDMVSSLVIGSEAAIIIDLPLAVPQALELADWVTNTTNKPLVAAFTTHFHPDHYLSAAAFLDRFPTAKFYASSETTALIRNEASKKANRDLEREAGRRCHR
ncbi:hypothetical protein FSARC_12825 [Fusarium sarcochroum]|uniref:Metallo-beta-lactamase domain-containing protein n=1 Tax=Fusarium sarcochroum TaxID=1208366 RepID=A0A8H4WVV7_9HYPO|nr:hypothetical protein FSARC_12825 [Fusarium sarcochroum]